MNNNDAFTLSIIMALLILIISIIVANTLENSRQYATCLEQGISMPICKKIFESLVIL